MTNYCHLSYEDRKNIEDGLNENKSINQIAKELNRSHSTILREIDRNKISSKAKRWTINNKQENPARTSRIFCTLKAYYKRTSVIGYQINYFRILIEKITSLRRVLKFA